MSFLIKNGFIYSNYCNSYYKDDIADQLVSDLKKDYLDVYHDQGRIYVAEKEQLHEIKRSGFIAEFYNLSYHDLKITELRLRLSRKVLKSIKNRKNKNSRYHKYLNDLLNDINDCTNN